MRRCVCVVIYSVSNGANTIIERLQPVAIKTALLNTEYINHYQQIAAVH